MSRLRFALVLSLIFFLTACLTPPQPALSEVENDLSEGGLLDIELSVDPVAETVTLASVNGQTGSELELEGYLDRYDLNFGVQSFSFDKESDPKTLTVNAVLTNKRDYGFWGFVVNASPLYEINSGSNFQDVKGMLLDLNYDGAFGTVSERIYQRPNDFIIAEIDPAVSFPNSGHLEPAGGVDTKLLMPLQAEFTSGSRFAIRIVIEAYDPVDACLREIARLQEMNQNESFAYTDHRTLFSVDEPEECDGVTVETVQATESDYLITGLSSDFSYQMTPRDGVIGAPKNSASTRLVPCLKEIATMQEVSQIDYFSYSDHTTLFAEYAKPGLCFEDIKIETAAVSESDYRIVGSLEGLSYSMTPRDGIIGAPRARVSVDGCLRELSTAQELHYIDNNTYTDHSTFGSRSSCEGIELETVEANENDYLIIGSLEDTVYQVTPSGGVEPVM